MNPFSTAYSKKLTFLIVSSSERVMNNYEMLEVEKANVRIANVRQRLIEKQSETEQLKAQIEARKIADVSKIASQKALLEKQTQQKINAISGNNNFQNHFSSLEVFSKPSFESMFYTIIRQNAFRSTGQSF